MGRVLFHMFGEPGHTMPTLKLAKALAARGHSVAYHALVDFRPQLEGEGLSLVPFMEDHFPRGSLRAEELPRLEARRRIVADARAVIEATAPGGAVERDLQAFSPDLVITDTLEVPYSLLVRTLGLRQLLFSTSLPQAKDPGVPPLVSGTPYRQGFKGRLSAELAWRKHLVKRRAIDAATQLIGLPTRAALARACPTRFGMARKVLDETTAFLPQLHGVPELVACPPRFDFPRRPLADRTYCESVDLSRREGAPMPELGDAPLVFCSMGTQAHRTPGVPAFLRRVIEALGREPHLSLLVVAGEAELGPAPPNVTVARRAPQLAVLRRASLMITHGGLGSVKECIAHGVPMNVYPLKDDQPGNAARVEYHGIGRAGNARLATADSIARLVKETLAAGTARVQAMREELLRFEGEGRGVAAVEHALRSRG